MTIKETEFDRVEDEKLFESIWKDKNPFPIDSLSIAFVGKASAGKSSLINAFFERTRENKIAEVGATSGTTTKLKTYQLGENVFVVDSPGLNDVDADNSAVTERAMRDIDVGVFVVTGSADASQKESYDALNTHAKKVFVVLNKKDEFAHLKDEAFDEVLKQWQEALQLDSYSEIICTACIGYDPNTRDDVPLRIEGVDRLKTEVEEYLRQHKKDLLLVKEMQQKDKYASRIISTALAAVGVEAFIPGSAIYITATQTAAIMSLYYLYTGKALDKSAALALLPRFAAQSAGMSVFLWAKSLLPPTGVVDVAAAGVAISITFAMLATVNYLLRNNIDIVEQGSKLVDTFNQYRRIDLAELIDSVKKGRDIKNIIEKMIK